MAFTEAAELIGTAAEDIWRDDQLGDGRTHYLSSSNVFAFSYLAGARELTVEYKGGTYVYYNIPTSMVPALYTASSPGAWANANLKGLPAQKA